jgi:hypothetical protein
MRNLIMFLIVCTALSCKKKSKQTPNPHPPNAKSEYFSYNLGGKAYDIPGSTITKDLLAANGYTGFYIGESTRNLYIDAEIKGSFVVNQPYNTSNLPIQIGINNNDPNRLTDTFFSFATLIVTFEDNTWIQGEFTAKDCKVKDLKTSQLSNLPTVLSDGKFSFLK